MAKDIASISLHAASPLGPFHGHCYALFFAPFTFIGAWWLHHPKQLAKFHDSHITEGCADWKTTV